MIKKLPRLILGFTIIALGIHITLLADLGMNPWGTFHQGVMLNSPLTFGQVTQLTGLMVIIFSLFLKIYPGVGTVLNMLLIGVIVDLIAYLQPIQIPNVLYLRLIYLFIGMVLFNYGVYVYISCNIGAGPRDGLLVGLVKITGKKVTYIRPAIEVTILIVGILLGGTFGFGTFVNAIGGGWMLHQIFHFHHYDPSKK